MGAFIFTFVVLVCSVLAKHEIYQGNEVYKVTLSTESELAQFHEHEEAHELDVWTHPVAGARDAVVMVTPQQKPHLLAFLDRLGVQYALDIPDVTAYLQKQDAELEAWRRQRAGRLTPFTTYPRFAQVDQYLDTIAAQYSRNVTLVNAGRSTQGRPIKYLKISTTDFNDRSKPIIFLDAMIHAREWVTTPVALHAINQLVENLAVQDRDLLNDMDWIILPIVNPDGYEHTHTNARLWRKTRSNLPGSTCIGVDGNRNFDIAFNTVGVSSNPCSDTYPGASAFSEPETRIVRDVLHEYRGRIAFYANIHSHGNYILYGWGNRTLPSNGLELHYVGVEQAREMDRVQLAQSRNYLVGNSAQVLYATSGSAQDYAQANGVQFSYTYELPGLGNAFQVQPQFINHINMETWLGLKRGARLARQYFN